MLCEYDAGEVPYFRPFVDPMLGTRFEERWIVDSSLRQVRVCHYRHSGSGACRSV
jgi:hypothetical protein